MEKEIKKDEVSLRSDECQNYSISDIELYLENCLASQEKLVLSHPDSLVQVALLRMQQLTKNQILLEALLEEKRQDHVKKN